jgi:hypothetical protein
MKVGDVIKSKIFHNILLGAACLVVLVFVFSAGVFVGIEKAKFSYGWGENYYRNFIDPRGPLNGALGSQSPFWDKIYITPHGLSGKIIELNDDGFVMSGANQTEVPVDVDNQTIIRNQHDNLKLSDLKISDQAVVIGEPDGQGEIMAKFVRIDDGVFH